MTFWCRPIVQVPSGNWSLLLSDEQLIYTVFPLDRYVVFFPFGVLFKINEVLVTLDDLDIALVWLAIRDLVCCNVVTSHLTLWWYKRALDELCKFLSPIALMTWLWRKNRATEYGDICSVFERKGLHSD